jgi:hypothetical protein
MTEVWSETTDWREKYWVKRGFTSEDISYHYDQTGKQWCETWGINADLISEEEFHYLSELDEFRRALWIAARKGV